MTEAIEQYARAIGIYHASYGQCMRDTQFTKINFKSLHPHLKRIAISLAHTDEDRTKTNPEINNGWGD